MTTSAISATSTAAGSAWTMRVPNVCGLCCGEDLETGALMPPFTTSAVGVALTIVVVPAPVVLRLCDRDGLFRFELPPPPLPLLPPPPPEGDVGVEFWIGAVALWPPGLPPLTGVVTVGGVTVGGVTGVVTGGAGTCASGSVTGGVCTLTDPTPGVDTLIGVFGTVTVSGGTVGVVTVPLGRIVLSAPAVAGRAANPTNPSIPTTAILRQTKLAPLSKWLPIRTFRQAPVRALARLVPLGT